jgi:hypothetical protein
VKHAVNSCALAAVLFRLNVAARLCRLVPALDTELVSGAPVPRAVAFVGVTSSGQFHHCCLPACLSAVGL